MGAQIHTHPFMVAVIVAQYLIRFGSNIEKRDVPPSPFREGGAA
jgi:hypothetical protein